MILESTLLNCIGILFTAVVWITALLCLGVLVSILLIPRRSARLPARAIDLRPAQIQNGKGGVLYHLIVEFEYEGQTLQMETFSGWDFVVPTKKRIRRRLERCQARGIEIYYRPNPFRPFKWMHSQPEIYVRGMLWKDILFSAVGTILTAAFGIILFLGL